MEKQAIQTFTRRLSMCNQGEMIVIMYDIFFAYLSDARNGYMQNDNDSFKEGIRGSERVLDELISSLDMSYEIAKTLYPLYQYSKKSLAMAKALHRLDEIDATQQIMKNLYVGFVEAAKKDQSAPLMSNTQQVYAGMTYGRNQLNESFMNNDHRGFFV